MVKIRIDIDERTNRLLNNLKKEYGLKNKSQAIELMIEIYAKHFLKDIKLE
jgi:uncharacterized protein Veg